MKKKQNKNKIYKFLINNSPAFVRKVFVDSLKRENFDENVVQYMFKRRQRHK